MEVVVINEGEKASSVIRQKPRFDQRGLIKFFSDGVSVTLVFEKSEYEKFRKIEEILRSLFFADKGTKLLLLWLGCIQKFLFQKNRKH